MTRKQKPATVTTTWEVWTYDVWGNAKDGYDVNDRFNMHRTYIIECEVTKYNIGSPQEFNAASPTDKQLREALGLTNIRIETDGDDLAIYVRRERDGYPVGELICTSHDS